MDIISLVIDLFYLAAYLGTPRPFVALHIVSSCPSMYRFYQKVGNELLKLLVVTLQNVTIEAKIPQMEHFVALHIPL